MRKFLIFSNGGTNKKIFFLWLAIITLGLLAGRWVNAAGVETIDFVPSVPLPGFNGTTTIGGDTNAIGDYINALYKYGSGFAALLAMFMLVIAGWQWMMAGGQPDRINRSKDIIIGVFVGLALLLGGNLLMSQISDRLVSFKNLNITAIPGQGLANQVCAQLENLVLADDPTNNNYFNCGYVLDYTELGALNNDAINNFIEDNANVLGQIQCVSQYCKTDGAFCVQQQNSEECPGSVGAGGGSPGCYCLNCEVVWSAGSTCEAYGNNPELCNRNLCYDATRLPEGCRYANASCVSLEDYPISCGENADCNIDLDQDGDSEYCCKDIINGYDKCGLISDTSSQCGSD